MNSVVVTDQKRERHLANLGAIKFSSYCRDQMSCHLWLGGLIKIRFQMMMKKNVAATAALNSNSISISISISSVHCDDMQMALLFN